MAKRSANPYIIGGAILAAGAVAAYLFSRRRPAPPPDDELMTPGEMRDALIGYSLPPAPPPAEPDWSEAVAVWDPREYERQTAWEKYGVTPEQWDAMREVDRSALRQAGAPPPPPGDDAPVDDAYILTGAGRIFYG